MITGTHHFVGFAEALRYYKEYRYADVRKTVRRKMREGEIVIGKPRLRYGQRLVYLDNGTRYGIVDED